MNKTKAREIGKLGMLNRWGQRFVCSIWPTSKGKTRITIKYLDKTYSFIGVDRMETLNRAFSLIKQEIKK